MATTTEPSLVHRSSPELDSDTGHHSDIGHPPLRENEGGWGHGGGYGYSGVGQNSSGIPYTYQPRRDTESSDDMMHMHERVGALPPQPPDMELPSATRARQMGSERTVGMGNWGGGSDETGGLPYLQPEAHKTPTQQTFGAPQRQWQSPANQRSADPSLSPPPPRNLNINAPGPGLHTFGVALADSGPTSPTVSINSAHSSKKSVELRGHAVGRSFRASIEGGSEYTSHLEPSPEPGARTLPPR
jgi:hypothetical protein